MRVGGATRTTLRSVLESWNLGDRSDSVLDAAVRELRQKSISQSVSQFRQLDILSVFLLCHP